MALDDDVPSGGLPVACTLGYSDGAARVKRWKALSGYGRPIARRRGHRLEVAYQPEPGVREELEALVALERQCCSFVAWDLSGAGDLPVLFITADPAAPHGVDSVATLFEAD